MYPASLAMMPPGWFAVPGFVLIAGALACGLYSAIVWTRLSAMRSWLPTLRAGLELNADSMKPPRVAVFVPAHNEEDVIGRCVRSILASEAADLRLILALDRCTDSTKAEAESAIAEAVEGCAPGNDTPRAEIVEITECPDGWAGKVHALHEAVERSHLADDADLLLFADADTVFDPGCVRAATAMLRERRLGLLSVYSTLIAVRPYEFRVQPVAAFELARQFPPDRVNDPPKRRAFANGQFMLFDANIYHDIGGHTAVKEELLEDLAFARLLRSREHDKAVGCLHADGLLRCEMYRDEATFERGWKRIYTEAAKRKPARLAGHARKVLLTGLVLPGAAAAATLIGLGAVAAGAPPLLPGSMAVIGLLALGQFFLSVAAANRIQHLPIWTALWHPYGAWRVAGILRAAAQDLNAGTSTSWGGRSYAREKR